MEEEKGQGFRAGRMKLAQGHTVSWGTVGSLFPSPQLRTLCCALDNVWGWISRWPLA